MRRDLNYYLKHPFWQAVLLLAGSYLLVQWGIEHLPPALAWLVSLLTQPLGLGRVSWPSAPVPRSIVLQYMLTALVAILIYVSENEARWQRFKEPIRAVLVDPGLKNLRLALLVLFPALVGWATYQQAKGTISAPAGLRTIHPAAPTQFTFRGRTLRLSELSNPLRRTGSLEEHYREGRRVYYQNCLPCHGDLLDGRGHFAHGFNPTPLPFDVSTIAQLSEAFVFWRIAKGGPGLPRESQPWNSAMPAWENILTEEEIWSVIIFLYQQAGVEPRRLTEQGAHGLLPIPARNLMAQASPTGAGRGEELYDKWCAGCHGETGRGDGPAARYMLPRPRDFTPAIYQIRTTASGQLPTDQDLMRILERGMPGTAMPGWSSILSAQDRREVIAYLKSFSPFFAQPGEPDVVRIGRAPRASEEGIEEGRQLYQRLECWKCHGNAGRADGPSAPTLKDRDSLPIAPADLTENWRFNGGGTVEDIFRRLVTGLDGTPMPSSKDLLDAGIVTEEQLWRLAQYVRSLSPREAPRVQEIIRAPRVATALPTHPDDSAWAGAEEFYVPLVGQIIRPPRWFAPRVDGIFVSALHDGEKLALRLRWHDPSQSPDPTWAPWRGAVARTMAPVDEPLDSLPRPDGVMVQFPRAIPNDVTRPYFLLGESNNPVYLWRWQSSPRLAEAGRATGLGTFTALVGGEDTPRQEAVFEEGEWRLVLTRSLAARDTANSLSFATGRPIPLALFAWDGDNGEGGGRMAISTWYYLVLEEPLATRAYLTPVAAAMLTGLLGWVVVWRAQRRGSATRTVPRDGA